MPEAKAPAELRLRVISALSEIDAAVWDACANPPAGSSVAEAKCQETAYNPFISYNFLNALEVSGSAVARTGWQPQHILPEAPGGAVLGAVPCYLKSHSRGEYVFDRGWAEAYERVGGSYYPKLQVSVPFTPATGSFG